MTGRTKLRVLVAEAQRTALSFCLLMSVLSAFLFLLAFPVTAQVNGRVLAVSFEEHGNELPCKAIAVQLRLRGRSLVVKSVESGFVVPDEVGRLSDRCPQDESRCDDHLQRHNHEISGYLRVLV